ncbi:MAG: LuxR C-terminal-related transcriptional regulator [Bacteroidota bacterium]
MGLKVDKIREMLKNKLLIIFFVAFALTSCFSAYSAKTGGKLDSLLKIHSDGNSNVNPTICVEIAKEYLALDSISKSITFYKKALSCSATLNDSKIADLYFSIGKIYFSQKNNLESLKYLLKAAEFFQKSDRLLDKINSLFYISKVFNSMNQSDLALKYLKAAESLYLSEKLQNDSIAFDLNIVHCTILYYGNQIEKSKFFNQKAYEISVKMKDERRQAMCLTNFAVYDISNMSFNNAIDYFKKSADIFKRYNDHFNEGNVKYNIAKCYTNLKDYKSAQVYLFEALQGIKQIKNSQSMLYVLDVYSSISSNYELQGDYVQSLKFYKIYAQTKDSLLNIDMAKKVNNIENQYQISKISSENKLLDEKNRNNTIKQIFLITVLLLIVFISGLIYRNLKISLKNTKLKEQILLDKNFKLDKELNYKGKELETFAHKIIQKNEILDKLNADINIIKSKNQSDENLKGVFQNISENMYLGKENINIESQLSIIQESFILRLKEASSLSKTEIKICSMLLLGMSTKDISTAMNISYESAKKNRHRIRKKLGLSTQDSLEDYLKNI